MGTMFFIGGIMLTLFILCAVIYSFWQYERSDTYIAGFFAKRACHNFIKNNDQWKKIILQITVFEISRSILSILMVILCVEFFKDSLLSLIVAAVVIGFIYAFIAKYTAYPINEIIITISILLVAYSMYESLRYENNLFQTLFIMTLIAFMQLTIIEGGRLLIWFGSKRIRSNVSDFLSMSALNEGNFTIKK